jgi:hypothetical protein
MVWEDITAEDGLLVCERKNRGYTARIEARLEDDRWMVYNIFFNDKDLNLTEEFEAKTREEAVRIIEILKQQPVLSITSLRRQMLAQKKKTQIKVHRAYKEYNVEKWFFAINGDKPINFVTLRFYDSVELDFVIHERYRRLEQKILHSIVATLGLEKIEEDLAINCYFFKKHTEHNMENEQKRMLLGKIEFGFESD